MGIKFNFFKALAGDSILVSTDRTNILIDGGYGETYENEIQPKLDELENLDLVVLTHIDADHICGLIKMVERDKYNRKKIKELWFNSPNHIKVERTQDEHIDNGHAMRFDKLLKDYNIPVRNNIFFNENIKTEYLINNEIRLHLLSPSFDDLEALKNKFKNEEAKKCGRYNGSKINKEKIDFREKNLDEIDISSIEFGKKGENSIENNSSIAFLMEYNNKKFLFLADANIDTINKSLITMGYSENKRLEVEFVKLSHHGSRNNINSDFLSIVKTDNFVILTNGKYHYHPNKEIFRLILEHEKRDKHINFIFNYEDVAKKVLTTEDEEEYGLVSDGEYTFKVYPKNTFPFRRIKL